MKHFSWAFLLFSFFIFACGGSSQAGSAAQSQVALEDPFTLIPNDVDAVMRVDVSRIRTIELGIRLLSNADREVRESDERKHENGFQVYDYFKRHVDFGYLSVKVPLKPAHATQASPPIGIQGSGINTNVGTASEDPELVLVLKGRFPREETESTLSTFISDGNKVKKFQWGNYTVYGDEKTWVSRINETLILVTKPTTFERVMGQYPVMTTGQLAEKRTVLDTGIVSMIGLNTNKQANQEQTNNLLREFTDNPILGSLASNLKHSTFGFGVIDISDRVTLEFGGDFEAPQYAREIEQDLNGLVQMGLAFITMSQGQSSSPQEAKVIKLATDLLRSVRVSSQGNRMSVQGSLGLALINELLDEAEKH